MRRRWVYFWPVLCSLSLVLGAAPASQGQSSPIISGAFGQEFNSYKWTWSISSVYPLGKSWFFRARENFVSSLLALEQAGDRWKDDQNLALEVGRPVIGGMTFRTGGRVMRFWDRQSGLPNDFSRQELFSGIDFECRRPVRIGFEAGPCREVRYRRPEWGWHWQAVGQADDYELGAYAHEALISWSGTRLGERLNHEGHLAYQVGREFQAGAADSFRVSWERFRRDQYVSPDLDREQLRESSVRVENRLHYALPGDFRAALSSRYFAETVEVRQILAGQTSRWRSRREDEVSNSLLLLRDGERADGALEITYRSHRSGYRMPKTEERTPFSRSVAFVAPDNQWSQLGLGSRLAMTLGARDSVSVMARVSKLQYDTPDTNNFDDHDELRWDLAAMWKHFLSPSLRLEVRLGAGFYHLVYIFAERSADNQWNRVFRVSPAVEVRPLPVLRVRQRFEVMANYVDYDFEDPAQPMRSFVFRRFLAEDSMRVDLSRTLRLQVVLARQLEETGRLYWDQFEERPLTGRQEWRMRLGVSRRLGRRTTVEAGFIYYDRLESRFQWTGATYRSIPLGRYVARGPLLALQLWAKGGTHVLGHVQRQRISPRVGRPYYTNFISLSAHWEL
ncbi:MAG: hypothetical protein ONB23_13535 [candidate division KSB1 bacterium]|nr:hypothetical protein [candidate division KSB1 bacterium]